MTSKRPEPDTGDATAALDALDALSLAPHLTDMMSRIPMDVSRLAKPATAPHLAAAAIACARCGSVEACEDWLGQHPEGEGEAAPGFCPNGRFLASLAPTDP